MWKSFWIWYEKNYIVNVGIASLLFLIQIVHLVWLTGDVVAARIWGQEIFHVYGGWKWLILVVDYTEIPAIIGVTLVYINDLRKRVSIKAVMFLIFLNLQWLHIFWITDEFVISSFSEQVVQIPVWFAWIAILIDYLELPVIFETLKKFYTAINLKDGKLIKEALKG